MKNVKRLTLPLFLAIVAVMVLLAGLTMAAKVDGYATYTFYTGNNVTAAAAGTAKVVADYGDLDCYQNVDALKAQRLTTTFEHSPDGTYWVSSTAVTAVETDSTTYAQIPISGAYMRIRTALFSANEITIVVKCTAKDRTQ